MQIANALAAAKRRGIKVKVVMEDSGRVGEAGDLPAENRFAYEYLWDKGVDVYYAASPGTMHAKAVVIDGETVLVGSANWSTTAFDKNVEASVLLRSTQAAADMLKELEAIPKRQVEMGAEPVPVPLDFFMAGGGMGKMVSGDSERAFDTYLYIWKEAAEQGKNKFTLNEDKLAEYLGIGTMPRLDYRRQINKVLGKLQDEYKLLAITPHFGEDPEVKLVSGTQNVPDTLGIPAEYWSFGWGRRLGFAGKVMLILSRHYSATFSTRPRWSMAEETMAGRHGLTRWFIGQGITELRRANLLDVEFDELPQNESDPRHPSIYTPLPLYDPKALEKKWGELEAKYGTEALARGQKCVQLVYKDSDSDAVEQFIKLEEKYGRDKVDQAYRIISQKAPGNPRRTVGYFINTIKGLK